MPPMAFYPPLPSPLQACKVMLCILNPFSVTSKGRKNSWAFELLPSVTYSERMCKFLIWPVIFLHTSLLAHQEPHEGTLYGHIRTTQTLHCSNTTQDYWQYKGPVLFPSSSVFSWLKAPRGSHPGLRVAAYLAWPVRLFTTQWLYSDGNQRRQESLWEPEPWLSPHLCNTPNRAWISVTIFKSYTV